MDDKAIKKFNKGKVFSCNNECKEEYGVGGQCCTYFIVRGLIVYDDTFSMGNTIKLFKPVIETIHEDYFKVRGASVLKEDLTEDDLTSIFSHIDDSLKNSYILQNLLFCLKIC